MITQLTDAYGWHPFMQGWGEYFLGKVTGTSQNDKHEYFKIFVLECYSSTDFPVLVLVCSILAPTPPSLYTKYN